MNYVMIGHEGVMKSRQTYRHFLSFIFACCISNLYWFSLKCSQENCKVLILQQPTNNKKKEKECQYCLCTRILQGYHLTLRKVLFSENSWNIYMKTSFFIQYWLNLTIICKTQLHWNVLHQILNDFSALFRQ